MKVKKGYSSSKKVMKKMEEATEKQSAENAVTAIKQQTAVTKEWENELKGKYVVRDNKKYLVYNNSGGEKLITFNISKIADLWFKFKTAVGLSVTMLELRKSYTPQKDPLGMKYYIINFMICGKGMVFYIKQRKFDLVKIVNFAIADCRNAGAPAENFSIFISGFSRISRSVAQEMDRLSKMAGAAGTFIEPDMSLFEKKPADKELN